MGALLPLITALISQAPAAVNLILHLIHPDGSQTIVVSIQQAEAADADAMTALQNLAKAIATAKAAKPTV